MIQPVGVTAQKKSNPITSGLITACNRRPNRNQALLSGASSPGRNHAETRNGSAMTASHGHHTPACHALKPASNANTVVITKPNARSEPGDSVSIVLSRSCVCCFGVTELNGNSPASHLGRTEGTKL